MTKYLLILFLMLSEAAFCYCWTIQQENEAKVRHKEHGQMETPYLNEISFCDGENHTMCFDALLDYIKIGQDVFRSNNETDLIMVVGLIGAGKSTIVQFIANETNSLHAVCRGTRCNITDDSLASDSNLKFVPHLVIDGDTDSDISAFYDIPGFGEHRNEISEIVNAYFIWRALENAQRIKIVIVIRKEDLDISDFKQFTLLLKNLCILIKEPTKFKNGIAIIANMANYHFDDMDHFIDYIDFIHEVNTILPNLITPQCLASTNQLIEIFIEPKQLDTDELVPANVGIMRKPFLNGSIRHDEILAKDYISMKQLIYNFTDYVEIQGTDFGYGISLKSEIFLLKASETVRVHIISIFEQITNKIAGNIAIGFEKLASGESLNNTFSKYLDNISSASFDFINETGVIPSHYGCRVWQILETFTDADVISIYKSELNVLFIFLDFAFEMIPNIDLYQYMWLNLATSIRTRIIENPKTQLALETLLEKFKLQFTALTVNYAQQVVLKINKLPSITDKSVELDKLYEILTTLEANFRSMKINGSHLSHYFLEVAKKYELLIDPSFENTIDYHLLETLENFFVEQLYWKAIDFVSIHSESFKDFVHEEKEFSNTLRSLQKDLNLIRVQSDREEDLYLWWHQQNGIVTKENFKLFWEKAERLNFHICESSTSGKFWSILTSFDILQRKKRLTTLFDTMLSGQPDCLNIDNMDLIYVGNSISIRNLPECNMKAVKNVVILAVNSIIFDKTIVGWLYNATENINLIVLAPKWHIYGEGLIDLDGVNGKTLDIVQNVSGSNGNNGLPGTHAGSFYGIFLNKIGLIERNFFRLNGGHGGSGQNGVNGHDGQAGRTKSFNAGSSNDCAAWLYGTIQVRLLPNSCNICTNNNSLPCTCHAGNSGVAVDIYGDSGALGGNGGNGGDGGDGGMAGNAEIIDLRNTVVKWNGTLGRGGSGGQNGLGGKGGENGDTIRVVLDDVFSRHQKICAEYSRVHISNGKQRDRDDGQHGKLGKSNNGTRPPMDIKVFISLLKKRIAMFEENEFLYDSLKEFLIGLELSPYIP